MDLVGYDEAVFERIRGEFLAFASVLGIDGLRFIPISALRGDLIVDCSEAMAWYRGPALLAALEQIEIADEAGALPLRFPVQLVVRPGAGMDFRGYAGRLESGTLFPGAELVALPSGQRTVVRDIVSLGKSLPVAVAGDPLGFYVGGSRPSGEPLILQAAMDVYRADGVTRVGLDHAPDLGAEDGPVGVALEFRRLVQNAAMGTRRTVWPAKRFKMLTGGFLVGKHG